MNTGPHLKFLLNKELDVEMGTEQLSAVGGGVDFSVPLIGRYPDLKIAKEAEDLTERRKIIADFVENFYSLNTGVFKEVVKVFERLWYPVEDKFYKATASVFGDYPWPEGKYHCYLSIFTYGPRFLDTKIFQEFYGKAMEGKSNRSIAHEMLHFIFFDYLNNNGSNYKNYFSEEKIWLMSEAFNDVVQALPAFELFKNSKYRQGYPDAADPVEKLKATLSSEQFSIDQFLEASKKIFV